MRLEISDYVRKCDLCQWAKPAQDMRVGLHAANPCSQPMERLFVDFVGPLTRTKQGNLAILVVVDGFSKFVFFFPVRKISSQVVSDCLERVFFSAFGTQTSVVTDNARVFCCKQFRDLCFRWGITHITTTPLLILPPPPISHRLLWRNELIETLNRHSRYSIMNPSLRGMRICLG
jgi:hypothetical protein